MAWNLYKTPWTQELKRNVRKNMKIPINKEKSKTTNYYTENHKDYQLGLNSLRSNRAEEMEVMIKNSVKKTYEWKHCKIQRFFQKEEEDYDNNLFQIYLL
jgi:hypothetical protein